MARKKNESLTIRTTSEVKAFLKLTAKQERRSTALMIEVLTLNYCDCNNISIKQEHEVNKGNNTK